MQTSLVIMAAGMGSRFGGGIKQLTPVGPNGELIIDYSIYDAINAGFNKVIIVLRRDIFNDFMEVIGYRIEEMCKNRGVEICYAFQDFENIPLEINVDKSRCKPWGTGHAVLAAKEFIKEPFVVINADDYYGKSAFRDMHDFIIESNDYCMAGFILKNTLSENGAVTRGICELDEDSYLSEIKETKGIEKADGHAIANGERIDLDSYVSMNMWGLKPEFIDILENRFISFLTKYGESISSEFLLPIIIDRLLRKELIKVKVLPTYDKWVGVTYQEDREIVINTISKYVKDGLYPQDIIKNPRV